MNALQKHPVPSFLPNTALSERHSSARLHQIHRKASRASLLTLLSLLQILLAGGREGYEGNKACFPTITSPRFKRLSEKKWCKGTSGWRCFPCLQDTVLPRSAILSSISTINCVWAGRVTHSTDFDLCLSTVQQWTDRLFIIFKTWFKHLVSEECSNLPSSWNRWFTVWNQGLWKGCI